MAGGEFRLGTDSIYMADDEHIRRKGTSPKFWITWLRFQRKYATLESFQLVVRIARRKLGLEDRGGGGQVPLLQQRGVGAVGGDLLEGVLDAVLQRRVVLADGDADAGVGVERVAGQLVCVRGLGHHG